MLALTGRSLVGQVITEGKVVFERRTNLAKKYADSDYKDWILKEKKYQVDLFDFYFNDTASAFLPQESEIIEKLGWTTVKNKVYQNFNSNSLFKITSIWSNDLYVKDSLRSIKWKITEKKRNIAGFECRKAFFIAKDSTKLYAWYTDQLVPSSGPERLSGLPGTILGAATEDGGVIYFAKSVTPQKVEATDLKKPKLRRNDDVYTDIELKEKLEERYGEEKWAKDMVKSVISIW